MRMMWKGENEKQGLYTPYLHPMATLCGSYGARCNRLVGRRHSKQKVMRKEVEKKPGVVIPYVQGVSDGMKRVLGGAGVRAVTKAQP